MTTAIFTRMKSPFGKLLIVGDRGLGKKSGTVAVRGIYFASEPHAERALLGDDVQEDAKALRSVTEQLEAYFKGNRVSFDMDLAPRGTAFQRDVWRALTKIPYGKTTTYAAIAGAIGRPKAVRAVGAANGRNPISIVVPCHRVIGKDGTLTGYAGGLDNKRKLLDLESAHRD